MIPVLSSDRPATNRLNQSTASLREGQNLKNYLPFWTHRRVCRATQNFELAVDKANCEPLW